MLRARIGLHENYLNTIETEAITAGNPE